MNGYHMANTPMLGDHKYLLYIIARGTHIMSLISLRGGQPSGPGGLSDLNLSNTDCGDISISEISGGQFVKVNDGSDVVSSEMKTMDQMRELRDYLN